MTVHPTPKNLAKDVVRQMWPKGQPRESRPKEPGRTRTLKIVGRRSGGLCERCGGVGHSTHHLKNRSQGGRWQPSNCVRLCGSGLSGCHGWITTHPQEAWEEGFHLKPWETPGSRSIQSKLHGRVKLTDDGGRTRPVCPGCWAILHLGRPPERIVGADEEDCCLCGDPTVSGLSVDIDPATVPYPTNEDA